MARQNFFFFFFGPLLKKFAHHCPRGTNAIEQFPHSQKWHHEGHPIT